MISYMLDTNICIELIRGKAPKVFARLRRLKPDEAGLSSVTLAELCFGVARSADPGRNRAVLTEFLAPLAILDFDPPAAQAYGLLRAELSRRGSSLGAMDMLIAAHALSAGCKLVTADRAFARVAGLGVENWAGK